MVLQQGHDGTEDLFLHDQVVQSGLFDDSVVHLAVLEVAGASHENLAFGALDHGLDSAGMEGIDNGYLARIHRTVCLVELFPDLRDYLGHYLVIDIGMDEDVVGGYTGLPTVGVLGLDQSLHGASHVAVLVDDARRLPA